MGGYRVTPPLEVHVLNVGRGSCNLFITPENETLLADIEGTSLGRHESTDVDRYIDRYIERISSLGRSISGVDYLLATHMDSDHFGNEAFVENTTMDSVFIPTHLQVSDVGRNSVGKSIERLQEEGVLPVTVSSDYPHSIVESDTVDINIVSPPTNQGTNVSKNDNSLCILAEYDDCSFLYPGDIQTDGVEWVVENDATNDIDCLIAPHHGSANGDYSNLLDHCQPEYVLISSAHNHQDSREDHPSTEFLTAIDERDCKAYWTAVHGNIVASSNGRQWDINPQQAYSTSPTDLGSSAVSSRDLCEFNPIPNYPSTSI